MELLSDHTDMDRSPLKLTAAAASGVTLELSDDAYFEYQWRAADGKPLADEQAQDTAPSIWYGTVNVIRGPAYRPDPLAVAAAAGEAAASLVRHRLDSRALGQQRRVNVYAPAGTEGVRLPAVLVQDGTAFFRLGRLAAALDAAVAKGLPPLRLVFLEPVDRSSEYRFSEAYRSFVLDEVVANIAGLAGPTAELYLLGASLGGLASASLALAAPETFSGVASFSGAFLGSPDRPDPYTSRDEWVRSVIGSGVPLPDRWFIGTGTLEWLHGPNERLAGALQQAGATVAYLERPAGHNWPNWRDMIGPALAHLTGSPVTR